MIVNRTTILDKVVMKGICQEVTFELREIKLCFDHIKFEAFISDTNGNIR